MESHHENYIHFRNTLFAELTQNLKPVIISLTMLAEDYCRSDVYIAKAIEEYIDEVSPDIKILGLYLIDSIMKNFKTNTSYIKIFERNIVSLFERVFKAVDENNRKALYKLRQTWLDLFNEQTLYDLDMRVKKIDQAWPITARVPVYVPTVVKPPVREVSQPPPQPLPVKKAESIPVKPVNSHKKSLFEVELESIPKNKNPIVKTTSQAKSPAKSIVNNKTKSESVKTSPVKNEKSPETKKQVMKQPIVNKLNNGEKKPIPANLTNNKKQKISPTTKLAAATITTSNDKQIIKKPIQKSPPVESKKEKPPEIIPKPSSGMKHPIVDKKDINSENVKRIKLTEPPRIVEKETIAEPTKDVDLRFMTQAPVVETTVEPAKIINIDINFVKNLLEDPSLKQILNNRTNQDQVVKEIDNEKKSSSPPTPPAQPVPQMETLAIEEKQNDEEDLSDFPPIRPKDISENSNDSLLIIDARSYRIQPNVSRTIKIYYHDHEVYCDTKNKDVYVDQKLVAKMGDNTKEIMLNGRRVRLMYMGKRIELWIDGMSFHFRADSPPKQISLTSSMSNQTKRYFVTIDSRTMDMYFNNFKVCTINGGPYGNGPSILMARLAPDDYEQHEISFVCPPKRVMIDGIHRKMRYDLPVPCIEMYNGQFHIIRFTGPPRDIYIDGQPYKVPFDKTVRIKLNGRAHELAWGGPGFEVIIDGRPYEVQFNKPEREIIIGTRAHSVCIYGEAPEVKICGRLPKEFCEKAQQTELKPTIVKPPPLMSQPMTIPTDPSIIKVAETITRPQVQKLQNVHDLLSKLKEYNILPGVGKPEKKDEDLKVPDLTSFDPELLKQKYTAAFKNLYSGNQCAECGNRFNKNDTSNTSSRYSKHLDWHFRQNKKEKEEINKARSRAWYYTLKDWVLFEEISDEQVVSTEGQIHPEDLVRENSQDSMVTDEPPNRSIFVTNGVKTCAATDDIGDSCCICNDPFEIFWYSEKEEWHFKDAIRVDNKIYHPICYEDKKEENEANQINNEICTPVKCEPV